MKILFIHVPRTAGTTTSRIIRNNYSKKQIWITRSQTFHVRRLISHQGPINRKLIPKKSDKMVTGHHRINAFDVGKLKDEGWKFVTTIRDPIERVISHYFWMKYRYISKVSPHTKEILQNLDIIDFTKMTQNMYHMFLGKDLTIYDYIVRQENFDTDIREMCNGLNLKFVDIGIIKPNKNTYTFEINDETREEMKKHLQKDYKVYNEALKRWMT